MTKRYWVYSSEHGTKLGWCGGKMRFGVWYQQVDDFEVGPFYLVIRLWKYSVLVRFWEFIVWHFAPGAGIYSVAYKKELRCFFTLREYWEHFYWWLRSFPWPWEFDDHTWTGPVDSETRMCILCKREMAVFDLDQLEDEKYELELSDS